MRLSVRRETMPEYPSRALVHLGEFLTKNPRLAEKFKCIGDGDSAVGEAYLEFVNAQLVDQDRSYEELVVFPWKAQSYLQLQGYETSLKKLKPALELLEAYWETYEATLSLEERLATIPGYTAKWVG